MMSPPLFMLFGILFGFILSRAGVTDYDAIAGMFRLTDVHLFGVIGSAIGTAALAFWALRRPGSLTISGGPMETLAARRHLGRIRFRDRLGPHWCLPRDFPGPSW